MDWTRYLRALDAQAVLSVEERKTALLNGDIKSMSPEEWEMIERHEELLRKYG